MNRCKGCVYWKWVKADKLYQTPGYHYCEKNKLTTCKRRAGEKEHYRITIDVIAEPDGVDRCSDIEHVVYLNKHELVPDTVRAEDVKYKVELLSAEAEKGLGWTWKDIGTIAHLIYVVNQEFHTRYDQDETGEFDFSRQDVYEEVLKRFMEEKK